MQMEEIGRREGLWNPQIRQTHDWWMELLPQPEVYSFTFPFLLSLACSAEAVMSGWLRWKPFPTCTKRCHASGNGCYWGRLGPAVRGRWVWHSSMPQVPAASWLSTRSLQAHTHTQSAHLHTTYLHIYIFTYSQSYIVTYLHFTYLHTYINPGLTGYRHTESTHEPSKHQCWHLEVPVPEITAPVQLLLQTNSLTESSLGLLLAFPASFGLYLRGSPTLCSQAMSPTPWLVQLQLHWWPQTHSHTHTHSSCCTTDTGSHGSWSHSSCCPRSCPHIQAESLSHRERGFKWGLKWCLLRRQDR